ncbi:MAG: hypothetical protein QW153_01250 [Candidatus Bilamarchaeaceae archaeon]
MDENTQPSEKTEIEKIVSEIEKNIFSLKFYPVAIDENAKDEAKKNLIEIYKKSNDTVRQIILFMLHEAISQYYEFKVVHVYDYFRSKNPQEDPTQTRMNVYRAMFNYNTSIEGIIEIIELLGKLNPYDDAAKVLTYHYARVASIETEAHIELRNAIINALGESDAPHALFSLIKYALYTDNEHLFQRIHAAIKRWQEKIEHLKIPENKKRKLREKLNEVLIKEFGKSHYR